jgi:hypothetical protein
MFELLIFHTIKQSGCYMYHLFKIYEEPDIFPTERYSRVWYDSYNKQQLLSYQHEHTTLRNGDEVLHYKFQR